MTAPCSNRQPGARAHVCTHIYTHTHPPQHTHTSHSHSQRGSLVWGARSGAELCHFMGFPAPKLVDCSSSFFYDLHTGSLPVWEVSLWNSSLQHHTVLIEVWFPSGHLTWEHNFIHSEITSAQNFRREEKIPGRGWRGGVKPNWTVTLWVVTVHIFQAYGCALCSLIIGMRKCGEQPRPKWCTES